MAVLRYVLKKSFRSTKLPFSKPSQALPSPIYINNYAVVLKSAITVLCSIYTNNLCDYLKVRQVLLQHKIKAVLVRL